MERLRGVVERLTYVNEENGFSVIKVKAAGSPELVTVVGRFAGMNPGAVAEFAGEWTMDARYGRQFSAASYSEQMPATLAGIEKYLGSGLIKGLGPVNARRIVRHFRERTLDVIENAPARLAEVPGVGEKRVGMIARAWQEHREIKNVMLFLQGHGVSTAYAIKIFKAYGDRSVGIVRENPYRLADDIWGIGFVTADRIAQNMGFAKDSDARCDAGLAYVLNKFSEEGHCYAPREDLCARAADTLGVDLALVEASLERMVGQKKIVREEGGELYLPPFYHAERGLAQRVAEIARPGPEPGPEARARLMERVEEGIRWTEAEAGVFFDDVQKDAVRAAMASRFMILTGGPGTGKTTTTQAILRVAERMGASVMLAAPTGRAAKRLAEATGREAKTVHRLLEIKPPEGYKRDKENPLPADLLIVDEASMLDLLLAYNLLKAVKPGAGVLLVGDVDQLPSVGPGNVLKDLIASGAVRVVSLRRIFRQAQGSDIVKNAHRVNAGQLPAVRNGSGTDFFFIEKAEPADVAAEIVELCRARLPRYYGVDPVEGVQVLCPMTRGEAGTQNLNAALQGALNPNREQIRYGNAAYRLGDKVMQIRNNYDKNVFNGDIGRIAAIDQEDRALVIRFDGQDVDYDVTEMDEVALAYAVTVHKSQGSEYPIVVCPITTQHFMMLQKNLLYTAITRAKRALVLVGTKKALAIAVRNKKSAQRNTLLAARVRALLPPLQKPLPPP
jgi:exodeoxyribonuclease V alpha subunit